MMRISTLALLLVVFLCLAAHAQRYDYVASSGTFTPITSATALDEIEADDVISSSFIPLGFTFNYFGTNYTQVRVSSNGFISFESPGSLSFNGIADGTASNLIAPLWDDLSGTGGQASYVTTGTGPNRVFTMEWLNWRWDYTALAAGISFQVKMYEGTNKIEFIYRQEAGALVSPDASIGLVGGTAPLFYSLDGSSSSALLAPAGVDIISTKPATGQVFAFTPSATPFTAPATQATNVNASGSGNNMSLNWTNGNGTYRAVFMKQTSSTTETVAPVDGTFYSPSSTFGNGSQVGTSGWYCVANLAGTFTTASINNLDNGFPYRIQVVEYNGLAGTQRYLSASATNNPVNFTTPVVTPTVSSSVQVLRTAATEVSISINNGNGARRAVFVRAGNSGTAPAVNSITYTANTLFGSGTQIGTTGWYCVFNGINAPSELIITGLAGNTDYRIHALDYNGANTTENYFISQITDNPAQLTTFVNVSVPTYTFSATAGTFTPISGGTDLNVIEEDEAQSGAVPIGFTFRHAGVAFTQLYASSNGFISFNPYSTGDFVNDLTAFVRRPLIAPLWDDLNGNTGQASYATTGTAPNRVFTLEWLNWKWSYFATAAGISFQVKLYESDNKIEFVYQQEAGALSSPSASIGMAFPRYGSPNFISLNNTGASPIASTSVETSSLALKPATGQVYSFVPAKLNQTITFGPLANRVFDPAPFALTATSSSGLPVTYASSNTNVATVAGNLVTLTGQGTITITASQAGDNTFNAAAVVTQSLTITPATLTLVFPQPADKTVGDPPFSLNISTTPSNADLGYEFTNPPVFALLDRAAGTITLQNVAGQIALKVTAGKSGYTTTSITRTFCVNPTKPPKVELLLGATDESLTLNVAFYTGIGDSFQWFRNGVDLNVTSSSRTLSITQPGVYSVSTIKGNCASVPSDGIPVVITDLLNKDKSEINIFPNPTDDSQQVTVDASGHARNGVIDVTVYDMMGRTKEQKSGSGSIQFSLSSYATGYYLFRVNTGTDIISKRIFKK